MHESEKWKWSCSVLPDSSRPHGLQPTRLLHPWDFPGKSTGVGCHCSTLTALLPKAHTNPVPRGPEEGTCVLCLSCDWPRVWSRGWTPSCKSNPRRQARHLCPAGSPPSNPKPTSKTEGGTRLLIQEDWNLPLEFHQKVNQWEYHTGFLLLSDASGRKIVITIKTAHMYWGHAVPRITWLWLPCNSYLILQRRCQVSHFTDEEAKPLVMWCVWVPMSVSDKEPRQWIPKSCLFVTFSTQEKQACFSLNSIRITRTTWACFG